MARAGCVYGVIGMSISVDKIALTKGEVGKEEVEYGGAVDEACARARVVFVSETMAGGAHDGVRAAARYLLLAETGDSMMHVLLHAPPPQPNPEP